MQGVVEQDPAPESSTPAPPPQSTTPLTSPLTAPLHPLSNSPQVPPLQWYLQSPFQAALQSPPKVAQSISLPPSMDHHPLLRLKMTSSMMRKGSRSSPPLQNLFNSWLGVVCPPQPQDLQFLQITHPLLHRGERAKGQRNDPPYWPFP